MGPKTAQELFGGIYGEPLPVSIVPQIDPSSTLISTQIQQELDKLRGASAPFVEVKPKFPTSFNEFLPSAAQAPQPEAASFTWPDLPKIEWPALPTWSWPALPTFAWPALPTFAWPALPTFSWPALPTWSLPAIPTPPWLGALLNWRPSLPGSLGGADSTAPVGNNASGTDNWKGGWAWVGERGPELLNLPKGSQILSNDESKKMIGQLADGTTTAAAAAPTGNGNVFSAIASAANNFVKASDKLDKAGQVISDSMNDLEANLRKVPGLFGASQVTEQQMKMGALGVPQNFADDWLRRLTDEVVNGVNWEGVDIKDAALRAGLDPGLPAEAILELVTQKWNDKSLFANAANLDLINQDAINTVF